MVYTALDIFVSTESYRTYFETCFFPIQLSDPFPALVNMLVLCYFKGYGLQESTSLFIQGKNYR